MEQSFGVWFDLATAFVHAQRTAHPVLCLFLVPALPCSSAQTSGAQSCLRPRTSLGKRGIQPPSFRPPPLLLLCLFCVIRSFSPTVQSVSHCSFPLFPPSFFIFRCFVLLSGLIYEEVLHYHPDQAARFRHAAAHPAPPAASSAAAVPDVARPPPTTTTQHPAAESEETTSSGASASKRPANTTSELWEPDQKRKRVAV